MPPSLFYPCPSAFHYEWGVLLAPASALIYLWPANSCLISRGLTSIAAPGVIESHLANVLSNLHSLRCSKATAHKRFDVCSLGFYTAIAGIEEPF